MRCIWISHSVQFTIHVWIVLNVSLSCWVNGVARLYCFPVAVLTHCTWFLARSGRCTLVNDAQTYVLALDEYRSKGGDPQHSLSDRTVVVPLCKEHFQQRCGSFCIRCSLIIEGPMLKIGEAKYHPACLRCADCDVQVNTEKTGPPKIHNHVIRCGPCFDEVQYDRCMQCNLHIKGQFIRYASKLIDPISGCMVYLELWFIYLPSLCLFVNTQ